MSYLLAALAIGLLITFHEFGHFYLARRLGMRVERFSIGFGPVIASWKRGETEYALSAVPLGGYVKVSGMAVEDEVEDNDPASYANKPAWARLLVIVAGPAANYLLAFLLGIVLLLAVHKAPFSGWTKIGEVAPGYPAAAAGIQPGDEVTAIDGITVTDWKSLQEAEATAAKKHPGQAIPVALKRGTTTVNVTVKPREEGGRAIFGITPADKEIAPVSLPTAVVNAARNVALATVLDVQSIGQVIAHHSASSLSGPIGIVQMTAGEARKGFADLLGIVWSLSIAVGFFNMLPFPGLDGGRFLFLVYEVVARRRMDQRVEGWIHGFGLLLLLSLILYVSYGDIMHLVRGG